MLEWANDTDVEAGLYVSGRLYRFWENFDVSGGGARWLAGSLPEVTELKRYPLARAQSTLDAGPHNVFGTRS